MSLESKISRAGSRPVTAFQWSAKATAYAGPPAGGAVMSSGEIATSWLALDVSEGAEQHEPERAALFPAKNSMCPAGRSRG